MEHSAKQVMATLADAGEVVPLDDVRQLTRHKTLNTIVARRRIAGSVIKAGRYYL